MTTLTIIEYARMKVTPDSPSAMLRELPMYCTVVLQLLYGGMSGAFVKIMYDDWLCKQEENKCSAPRTKYDL
jgi:hypothetical protein